MMGGKEGRGVNVDYTSALMTNDLMDNVQCSSGSSYFHGFTLTEHEYNIHHMQTECWMT